MHYRPCDFLLKILSIIVSHFVIKHSANFFQKESLFSRQIDTLSLKLLNGCRLEWVQLLLLVSHLKVSAFFSRQKTKNIDSRFNVNL